MTTAILNVCIFLVNYVLYALVDIYKGEDIKPLVNALVATGTTVACYLIIRSVREIQKNRSKRMTNNPIKNLESTIGRIVRLVPEDLSDKWEIRDEIDALHFARSLINIIERESISIIFNSGAVVTKDTGTNQWVAEDSSGMMLHYDNIQEAFEDLG